MASGTRSQVRARQAIQERMSYIHKNVCIFITDIRKKEHKLELCSEQVNLLLNSFKDIEVRLDRAVANAKYGFEYALKLQLENAKYTHNKFIDYIKKTSAEFQKEVDELYAATEIHYSRYLAELPLITEGLARQLARNASDSDSESDSDTEESLILP